jgi:hypothetical protein
VRRLRAWSCRSRSSQSHARLRVSKSSRSWTTKPSHSKTAGHPSRIAPSSWSKAARNA